MRLYWLILITFIGLIGSLQIALYKGVSQYIFNGPPTTKPSLFTDADFKIDYQTANEYFNFEEYNSALTIFEKLLHQDPENCNLNFFVGVCYLNSTNDRLKSITYLEKASRRTSITYSNSYKETSAPVFAFLHLGQAYHLNYQFNEAIKAYKRFQNFFSARTRDEEYLNLVKRYIEISNNAKELTSKSASIKITPITPCNTTYDEMLPAISPDGLELYFSSRRKGNLGGTMIIDGGYADDIYSSAFIGGVWQKPKAIRSTRMNTNGPDIMGSIAADNSLLFLAGFNGKHIDILICKQVGKKGKKKWGNPENIGAPINSNENEFSACISPDGQTIYFVSDIKGGYGGKDLYSSQRISETKWAKPINLGPKINSQYNEETPFMAKDGVTLYFSSNGHNTIGGLDVFSATFEDGNWSESENIGVPINTTFDDSGFKLNTDESKGYYNSSKGKKFGEQDIFEIQMPTK